MNLITETLRAQLLVNGRQSLDNETTTISTATRGQIVHG